MSTTIDHRSASRTVDGIEAPPAGTYVLDESHTHVGFVARHLVVAKTRGRFAPFRGTVVDRRGPASPARSTSRSTPPASTPATSAATSTCARPTSSTREAHPTLRYRSTGVRAAAHGRFVLDGELTVRDVTRPVAARGRVRRRRRRPLGRYPGRRSAPTPR